MKDILAQFIGCPSNTDAFDLSALLNDLPENRVTGLLNDVRCLFEDHLKACIRAIGTIALHGLFIGHPGKGPGQEYSTLSKHHDGQFLYDVIDEFLIDESGLHIQLGKLRLPVGSQIFVAETLYDLKVAVHSAHHEDLFEELRGLG